MINFRASNRAQDSLSIAVWDLDESPSRAEIDVLSRGSLDGDGGGVEDIGRALLLKVYPISDNSNGSLGRISLLPSLR